MASSIRVAKGTSFFATRLVTFPASSELREYQHERWKCVVSASLCKNYSVTIIVRKPIRMAEISYQRLIISIQDPKKKNAYFNPKFLTVNTFSTDSEYHDETLLVFR
jgi:hypothetical protein